MPDQEREITSTVIKSNKRTNGKKAQVMESALISEKFSLYYVVVRSDEQNTG